MRFALTLFALAALLASTRTAAADANSCIRFWGETRYGALAYNHIVHVANSCEATADCAVSTDVNPQPQEVEVEGGSSVEVMTFMGSPARTFKPRVKCTMRE